MMHSVTLLTGSNEVDACDILKRTAELLAEHIGKLERSSALYASEPWGFTSERGFWNQALIFSTSLEPEQVLQTALLVEQMIGRRRDEELNEKRATGERYASRVVDVDVMFYDARVINTPTLTVPHPLLHVREFALRPLCEIMGDFVHPLLGMKLSDIITTPSLQGAEK